MITGSRGMFSLEREGQRKVNRGSRGKGYHPFRQKVDHATDDTVYTHPWDGSMSRSTVPPSTDFRGVCK